MSELRPLTAHETGALESGLRMARRLVGTSEKRLSTDQVQALYEVLLAENSGEELLIALGLAFGELIVSRSNFEWVRVSNEYGDETVVAPPGKEVFCAPISMMQKRIERREHLDVSLLCYDTIAMIEEHIEEGNVADR